jgi:hypothetical protein
LWLICRQITSGLVRVGPISAAAGLPDEAGDLTSAVLGRSIHPTYDRELVDTARTWKFRPAMKDGVPVKYRMTIEIRLGPGDL